MNTLKTLAAVLLFATAAQATTIKVPGQYAKIQDAISHAAVGDVVLVSPGTYHETIDFLGKDITVKSTDGPGTTVIDGGKNGSVVVFAGGEGRSAVLEGFRITNGKSPYWGGGIYCETASPTIRLNVLDGHEAPWGGCAIACRLSNCSPLIQENEITSQTYPFPWGAIYSDSASPVIEENNIHDNLGDGIACVGSSYPVIRGNAITGNKDHGVFCDGLAPEIKDNEIGHNGGRGVVSWSSNPGTTISGNHISDNLLGGVDAWGTLSIAENRIHDNWNEGIVCGGSLVITGNMVMRNRTATIGGGIYCEGDATIVNNIVCDNAAQQGGGLYLRGYQQTVTNNTISGNTAEVGGGVYCDGAHPTITNTIVWGNQAFESSGLHDWASSAVVTFSDVQGGAPGAGNIDVDPLFSPEPDDYHIGYTSPCRNAGDNNAPLLPAGDHEGNPRTTGGTADIGADEFHVHLYCLDSARPGQRVRIGIVGRPGEMVELILGARLNDPPVPTPYGDLYIPLPPLAAWTLGTTPGNGILIFSPVIPATWTAGYRKYLQALVGQKGSPNALLTDPLTLIVE